jgi:hypothetical protein
LRAELRFVARSFHLREFRVEMEGRRIFETRMSAARQVISLKALELRPGETVLTFIVSGETSKADDGTPGEVMFKMENPQAMVDPL